MGYIDFNIQGEFDSWIKMGSYTSIYVSLILSYILLKSRNIFWSFSGHIFGICGSIYYHSFSLSASHTRLPAVSQPCQVSSNFKVFEHKFCSVPTGTLLPGTWMASLSIYLNSFKNVISSKHPFLKLI